MLIKKCGNYNIGTLNLAKLQTMSIFLLGAKVFNCPLIANYLSESMKESDCDIKQK